MPPYSSINNIDCTVGFRICIARGHPSLEEGNNPSNTRSAKSLYCLVVILLSPNITYKSTSTQAILLHIDPQLRSDQYSVSMLPRCPHWFQNKERALLLIAQRSGSWSTRFPGHQKQKINANSVKINNKFVVSTDFPHSLSFRVVPASKHHFLEWPGIQNSVLDMMMIMMMMLTWRSVTQPSSASTSL